MSWPDKRPRQVIGIIDGSAPGAGEVGELKTAQLLNANAVSLVNNVAKSVISLLLTPGRWDVDGIGQHLMTGLTGSNFIAGVSLTDNALDGQDTYAQDPRITTLLSSTFGQVCPVRRIVVAVPTFIYLVQQCSFALGANKAAGSLRATRVA